MNLDMIMDMDFEIVNDIGINVIGIVHNVDNVYVKQPSFEL